MVEAIADGYIAPVSLDEMIDYYHIWKAITHGYIAPVSLDIRYRQAYEIKKKEFQEFKKQREAALKRELFEEDSRLDAITENKVNNDKAW